VPPTNSSWALSIVYVQVPSAAIENVPKPWFPATPVCSTNRFELSRSEERRVGQVRCAALVSVSAAVDEPVITAASFVLFIADDGIRVLIAAGAQAWALV